MSHSRTPSLWKAGTPPPPRLGWRSPATRRLSGAPTHTPLSLPPAPWASTGEPSRSDKALPARPGATPDAGQAGNNMGPPPTPSRWSSLRDIALRSTPPSLPTSSLSGSPSDSLMGPPPPRLRPERVVFAEKEAAAAAARAVAEEKADREATKEAVVQLEKSVHELERAIDGRCEQMIDVTKDNAKVEWEARKACEERIIQAFAASEVRVMDMAAEIREEQRGIREEQQRIRNAVLAMSARLDSGRERAPAWFTEAGFGRSLHAENEILPRGSERHGVDGGQSVKFHSLPSLARPSPIEYEPQPEYRLPPQAYAKNGKHTNHAKDTAGEMGVLPPKLTLSRENALQPTRNSDLKQENEEYGIENQATRDTDFVANPEKWHAKGTSNDFADDMFAEYGPFTSQVPDKTTLPPGNNFPDDDDSIPPWALPQRPTASAQAPPTIRNVPISKPSSRSTPGGCKRVSKRSRTKPHRYA